MSTSWRDDVAQAFPKAPFAGDGGFIGDLVLPDTCKPDEKVSISIVVDVAGGERKTIYSDRYVVSEPARSWPMRYRSYNLAALLHDPYSGQSYQAAAASDPADAYKWLVVAGTPHFLPRRCAPTVRLLETGVSHPWGKQSQELIAELDPDELFLDYGAGIKRKDDLLPNALLLDATQFPFVDIVSTSERLPFGDNIFQLVISQAVFEHVANPSLAALEILRVLKPGGKVLIDTAFMQPFHGDPNHYFNMTTEGLRKIMEHFEIISLGVQPYQMPSDGLIMQLESVLPLMKPGRWDQRLRALLDDLRKEGRELDRDLGPAGQRRIAAGVSVLARKR